MLTKAKNYVKLSVRAERILDDATSIPRPTYRLKDGRASYVTTWTFPCQVGSFGSGAGSHAFASALDKRAALQKRYPHLSASAFQLSSCDRTSVRGLIVIGEPVRIPLQVVDSADDLASVALDRFLANPTNQMTPS